MAQRCPRHPQRVSSRELRQGDEAGARFTRDKPCTSPELDRHMTIGSRTTSKWFPTHIPTTQWSRGKRVFVSARRVTIAADCTAAWGGACGRNGRYGNSMAAPARCCLVLGLQSRQFCSSPGRQHTPLSTRPAHLCQNDCSSRHHEHHGRCSTPNPMQPPRPSTGPRGLRYAEPLPSPRHFPPCGRRPWNGGLAAGRAPRKPAAASSVCVFVLFCFVLFHHRPSTATVLPWHRATGCCRTSCPRPRPERKPARPAQASRARTVSGREAGIAYQWPV